MAGVYPLLAADQTVSPASNRIAVTNADGRTAIQRIRP